MRNGSVDSTAPALLGYLSSSSNRELLELTKEALDTALVFCIRPRYLKVN